VSARAAAATASVPGVRVASVPDRARVLAGLSEARARLGAADVAELELEGRLIRPVLALAVRERLGVPDAITGDAFWTAALAVQLVHEASLVHDDVVDEAWERRGRVSYAARHGVPAALLYGDRLLTAGLRAATETRSLPFARLLADAADRTVAGERAQRAAAGRRLSAQEYRSLVADKTGALLGAAFAAAPVLGGHPQADRIAELGRRLGLIYQMADDLLDYCPGTDRGKPALRDLCDGRWSWVLDELEAVSFEDDPSDVARRLARRVDGAPAPLERCVAAWLTELENWRHDCATLVGPLPVLEPLLGEWSHAVRRGVEREVAAAMPTPSPRPATAAPAGAPSSALLERVRSDWRSSIGVHSRSFSFAARFAPAERRRQIAAVYAYCRATDDLVDGTDAEQAAPLLREWAELSGASYAGRSAGIAAIDVAMGDMREAGVPFRHAAELIEGMRMDLLERRYQTLAELRVYTYRVASVVGLWLTELFGRREPWLLERAEALGHAMQLTNILRDVGEDLERGRIYLPGELLARHGVDPVEVRERVRAGEPAPRAWVSLVEELIREADRNYELAWEGIPALPRFFAAPVAVAAEVYRGIHEAIRANGHDDLTRRAYTGRVGKLRLASRALRRLRREGRRFARRARESES